MTFDWPTKLRRCMWSVPLLLSLTGCQTTPPPELKPAEVDAQLPVETIKSICLAWFNKGLPTWQDSDAEQTKDEIDRGYRAWDAVCLRYMKGK